jgi:hypothetical protein
MSKHDHRIAKLSKLERRSRTVARLLDDKRGKAVERTADRVAVEIGVLKRSTEKRAAEHRGQRPPQKRGGVAEYRELMLKLKRLPNAVRSGKVPVLNAKDEVVQLFSRLNALAVTLGLREHDRVDERDLNDELDVLVRVKLQNAPEEVRARAHTLASHQGRNCWCNVCRFLRTGQITKTGVYVDKTPPRRFM